MSQAAATPPCWRYTTWQRRRDRVLPTALLAQTSAVHSFNVIDPARLGTAPAFGREARAFIDWLREGRVAPGFDKVRIAGDPEREYRATLPGRVELLVTQYQRVTAGQPLARIDSPQWAQLRHELRQRRQGAPSPGAEEQDRLRVRQPAGRRERDGPG